MARLKRVTNKIFGETASTTGDSTNGPYIGQFGSAKKGTYFATSDVATIQNLDGGTEWANGWIDSVIPSNQYPTLPEMTGVNKVLSYQTGYLFQEGIPEWDANTEYHTNSIVKYASSTSTTSVTASIGESTGITAVSVTQATFLTQLSADGQYKFIYDNNNSVWQYNGVNILLSTYGLSVTGTPNDKDEIIVTVETTVTVTGTAKIYVSIADNNTGNLPTNTSYWSENTLNLANIDLSNLSATGNNKILPAQSTATATQYLMSNGTSAEWTDFSGANTNLSNLTQNGENHFANPSLNNLNETGEAHFSNPDLSNLSINGDARLHALKGYEDNGELLTDAVGLADVRKYAHSTFDESKFTKVGSPIVTTDGIASGFSNTSSIKTTENCLISNGHKTIFYDRIYVKASPNDNQFFISTGAYTTAGNFNVHVQANTLKLRAIFTDSTDNENSPDLALTLEKWYDIKIVIDGTLLSIYAKELSSNSYTLYYLRNLPASYSINKQISIGNNQLGGMSFKGSIDLKQFSITVDGVPVFSGNKTGIDTIKADVYDVYGCGQITITDDGILSGYDHTTVTGPSQVTNYAYIPNSVITQIGSKNWKLEWEKLYIAPSNGNMFVFGNRYYTTGYSALNIGHFNQEGNAFFANLDLDIGGVITKSSNIKINTLTASERGKYYKGSFEFKNGVYTLTMDFGGGDVHTASLTSSYYLAPSNYNLWINSYFDTPIDLNTIKLYIEDDLVYQPCLKIPYTESKTGSKIVDSYYRDRVLDAWEQNYPQRYYTLDEENGNFTIPCGEIYGTFVNHGELAEVNPMITTYINGTSGYNIWANGYCEQWGRVTGNNPTVSLTKKFANTNYLVLVSQVGSTEYNANLRINTLTASSFSIYVINDSDEKMWWASGYLADGEY